MFVLVWVVLAASPARGWNGTGHQVIAQIAWNDLKPAVREKLSAILKEHPQYNVHLAPSDTPPDSPDLAMRVFMRASTWPDQIRSGRGRDREFHHPEWHYVNFPIFAGGLDRGAVELPPLGDKLEEGKPPQNILQALEWCMGRLKGVDVSNADKAVALAWLEHLVGDLHQPLHSCALFSPDYPKGDRGGNSFVVKYHGNVTNLHSFWDERLGGFMNWNLVRAVTEKTAGKHPRSSLQKELAATGFTDWSTESYNLAKDVVYAGGTLKGTTREASAADKGASAPELPEKYDEAANDAARLRVALAGYRLADLLNRTFE